MNQGLIAVLTYALRWANDREMLKIKNPKLVRARGVIATLIVPAIGYDLRIR